MAATTEDRRFFRLLTERLGKLGIAKARPRIPSRTLRRALISIRITDQQIKMHITHYWAHWVHEGRGPIRPGTGRFLAWYRNPRDDPRLSAFGGQTPPRASQLVGLKQAINAAQFRRDADAGKIVFVERADKVTGVPFFSNDAGGGMRGFVDQANTFADPLVRAHILKRIGKENLKDKQIAELTLGF